MYVFTTFFFISSSPFFSWVGAIFISTGVIGYGVYRINKNKFDMAAVMSIGMVMNALFYFLGVYLADVFKPLALVITIAGAFISFLVMFFYFFWKQGRRRIEFIVKQERADIQVKPTVKERYAKIKKFVLNLISIHARSKQLQATGETKWFSYQLAYVEYARKEEWEAPKNALDFAILKEVELNRNEYNGEDGKRRIL